MIIIVDGKEREMDFSGNASELIRELGFLREEVIVTLNKKPVPDNAVIEQKDSKEIEVSRVIFS
jgi:sulfur carrier protein ThiS